MDTLVLKLKPLLYHYMERYKQLTKSPKVTRCKIVTKKSINTKRTQTQVEWCINYNLVLLDVYDRMNVRKITDDSDGIME